MTKEKGKIKKEKLKVEQLSEVDVKAQMMTKEKGKGKIKKDKLKVEQLSEADIKAQMAIGEGKIAESEEERRVARDLRTLFLKFTSKTLPTQHAQVKELHSGIKHVATPKKIGHTDAFSFAFVEFSNEEECVSAKAELTQKRFNDSELIVDFVGAKSKLQKKEDKKDEKFNDTRLVMMNLIPGMTKTSVKEMFPKCNHAELPLNWKRRGNPIAFIQFSNPADAKAAFDASQNLDIKGHKLTVLYAKITDAKEEVLNKKLIQRAIKRKINDDKYKERRREKRKEEKLAKQKLLEESDEENDDDQPQAKKAHVAGNDDDDESGDDE